MKTAELRDYKFHVIIDNIRSAFNVGSIFRTAEATGSAMLHICGISPTPENPKLEKTALGAMNFVEWAYYRHTRDAIDAVKKAKIPVYAIEIAENSELYSEIEYELPSAFVFGHEVSGVSKIALDTADKTLHIPMLGMKSSLNVATAAGIILFEALRKAGFE